MKLPPCGGDNNNTVVINSNHHAKEPQLAHLYMTYEVTYYALKCLLFQLLAKTDFRFQKSRENMGIW